MEAQQIAVSIIIPTYNRSELLNYTLQSIKKQVIDKSVMEVIVVDDGSTDDTPQVVEKYKNELNIHYCYQENKGYRVASARNMGLRQAKGEIIVFVDSGVLLGTHCIQAHWRSHKLNKKDCVVVGYIYALDVEDDEVDAVIKKINTSNPDETMRYFEEERTCLDLREKVYTICNDEVMQLPAPWVLFWTGNVSVKKKNIMQAGVFDTNFDTRWGMEDIDLGYRLYRNRLEFMLNRNASSIHYPHSANPTEKLKQEYQNKIYFSKKHNTFETGYLLNCSTVDLNIQLSSVIGKDCSASGR